jgi:hypothetical protein
LANRLTLTWLALAFQVGQRVFADIGVPGVQIEQRMVRRPRTGGEGATEAKPDPCQADIAEEIAPRSLHLALHLGWPPGHENRTAAAKRTFTP